MKERGEKVVEEEKLRNKGKKIKGRVNERKKGGDKKKEWKENMIDTKIKKSKQKKKNQEEKQMTEEQIREKRERKK